jgi:hypothetical protein
MPEKKPKNELSRQRLWQKKQVKSGRCMLCSEPVWRKHSCYCERHRQERNARWREKYSAAARASA